MPKKISKSLINKKDRINWDDFALIDKRFDERIQRLDKRIYDLEIIQWRLNRIEKVLQKRFQIDINVIN